MEEQHAGDLDSAMRLRSLLRAAPIGIGLVSNRVVLEVSDEICRMTGYSRDELIGKSARIFYPDEAEFERVGREKYGQIAERGTGSVTTRWKTRDGRVIAVQLSSSPINPDNWSDGVTFTALDVTDRLASEQALRDKTEELDRFFSSALDLLCIADVDGRFRRLNPEWERTLGYRTGELVGRRFLDFVHPDDVDATVRAIGQLSERREVLNFVNRYRHRDGSWRWIEWRSFPAGRMIYASARDITARIAMEQEQIRLQSQLQQASKMEAIGRLAGGVAHDFNNVLTSILGNVELALMDIDPDHPLAAILAEVGRAANSAASLTRQLLAFSRKQIVQPAVIDLNDLIGRLQQMLVRLLGENVVLETRLAPGLGSVRVDPGQFEQVIVNLAINARDAMPHGGRLVIETADVDGSSGAHPAAPPGAAIMVAASDTGHGMTPEVLSHLFEPFFTTKPKEKGTGLGLATTYSIVKQAGGTIDVDSVIGKGTTFRVYLPRAEQRAAGTAELAGASDFPRGRGTVLLVEDEDAVRELAVKILERLGYRLLVAGSGDEAIVLAEGHGGPIDVLLTDVVMPGMSGRDVANRLVPLHPEMEVLYTSGYTEEVIAHHGVLEPGIRFLAKPYTPQSLAGAVQAAIRRARH
jgi:two-component system, cell cycle sensor histidine kinase and response regulator CckA